MKAKPRKNGVPPLIGWREWVALPDLGVGAIKAKVDTGARTSALHAWKVERFIRKGQPWVRFDVHPVQRDNKQSMRCEAPLLGTRVVRNSGGGAQERLVIRTALQIGGRSWPIDVTLTSRDQMGFRMLLGRTAVRGRFVVDPKRSFLLSPQSGTRPRAQRKRMRQR
ncbi:MAG: ATP-dependent zinc protease [Pseudomonadota bacterium]